jgi:transketolase C-terminal domain/subunit
VNKKMTANPRDAYGETLVELGGKNRDIVVLDADLSKSTKTILFAKKYPERFFEMGIAEAKFLLPVASLFLLQVGFMTRFALMLHIQKRMSRFLRPTVESALGKTVQVIK